MKTFSSPFRPAICALALSLLFGGTAQTRAYIAPHTPVGESDADDSDADGSVTTSGGTSTSTGGSITATAETSSLSGSLLVSSATYSAGSLTLNTLGTLLGSNTYTSSLVTAAGITILPSGTTTVSNLVLSGTVWTLGGVGTLAAAPVVSLTENSTLTFAVGDTIALTDGGTATLADGTTLDLAEGSTITLGAGGSITSGDDDYGATLAGGSTVTLADGSTATLPDDGGTVTFDDGVVTTADGNSFTLSDEDPSDSGGTVTANPVFVIVHPVAVAAPVLTGTVSPLKFKTGPDGSIKRVKATVSLSNAGASALRQVTATVYLSDDSTLDAEDLKLADLKLSDFVHKGKIRSHKTVKLPFSHKVPSVLAPLLEGKYLIATLSAKGLPSTGTQTIVFGPIKLP